MTSNCPFCRYVIFDYRAVYSNRGTIKHIDLILLIIQVITMYQRADINSSRS